MAFGFAAPNTARSLEDNGSAIAAETATEESVRDDGEVVRLVKTNLAERDEAVRKSVTDCVFNGSSFVSGFFRVVVGDLFALQVGVNEADVVGAEFGQILNTKAMNDGGNGWGAEKNRPPF